MTNQTPSASGPKTPRRKMLEHAADLIDGDRNHTYGSPTQNFENIAKMWSIRFQHLLKDDAEFTASDVADAQIIVKVARAIANKTSDTYTDIAGYAACGHEIEFGEHESGNSKGVTIHYGVEIPGNPSPSELARDIQAQLDRTYGRSR